MWSVCLLRTRESCNYRNNIIKKSTKTEIWALFFWMEMDIPQKCLAKKYHTRLKKKSTLLF